MLVTLLVQGEGGVSYGGFQLTSAFIEKHGMEADKGYEYDAREAERIASEMMISFDPSRDIEDITEKLVAAMTNALICQTTMRSLHLMRGKCTMYFRTVETKG